MEADAKVYVAGHRGLVGSALLRALQARGYSNLLTRTRAELDLTDQSIVDEFFRGERPEHVFLAAAKVGGIHANNTYPGEFIRDNLAIQTNVIHAAFRSGVKRLLFLGSSCIYPKLAQQPLREDYLLTGPLEATNRPYAVAKIAGIEMCWSYNRQYGTNYLAAMPTNLYGPGDNYDLMNSHVIPAMIRKFHLAKLAAEHDWEAIERDEARHGVIPGDLREALRQSCVLRAPSSVTLWGTGSPRREFLYSDDMADACVHLMNLPDDRFDALAEGRSEVGEIGSVRLDLAEGEEPFVPPLVNIGAGADLTIRELADIVGRVVGFEGEVVFDSSKPDGTPRKLLDSSRLYGLGWKPGTSLPEGIGKAYEAYCAD
jgi:GDP-L-fucose synthase